MVWKITPGNLLVDDPDAIAYLAAVEAADGQALESGVRLAVNAFVKGCKADGIWPAIKASCILAGARTLSGALVPLAGAAPTNNNFVNGDYNRKQGVGDASNLSKWINSNRSVSAESNFNKHFSVYITTATTGIGSYGEINTGNGHYIGFERNGTSLSVMHSLVSGIVNVANAGTATGLIGVTRSATNGYSHKVGSNSVIFVTATGGEAVGSATYPLSRYALGAQYSTGTLAFYSIGTDVNLDLLSARVTTLINALSAAIP